MIYSFKGKKEKFLKEKMLLIMKEIIKKIIIQYIIWRKRKNWMQNY